jgi:serine/threonine-protein kinase RsbW
MASEVHLKLTGPMDHLRLVWLTGETLLESVVFDEDPEGTRYHVLVALQEMVTNVLRHAYDLDESKPVEVIFKLGPDLVEITLRDQGPMFDPLAHDTSTVDATEAMPTDAGGFGIYISRMVMDGVAYERKDGWNVLRMHKHARVALPAR